ncbi:MAG: hypothetical protein ACYDD1_19995, partial [Caulobacteraceae bacterium]
AVTSEQRARLAVEDAQRAFIYPAPGQLRLLPDVAHHAWRLTPQWMNSGETPTSGLRLETHCGVFPTAVDDPTTAMRIANHIAATKDLGPNETAEGVTCTLPGADLQTAIDGRGSYFYLIRAAYADAFGRAHIFEACDMVVTFNGDGLTFDHPISFATTPCKTHNCTDDQCTSGEV